MINPILFPLLFRAHTAEKDRGREGKEEGRCNRNSAEARKNKQKDKKEENLYFTKVGH
jgi:hypothetical protein